MYDPTATSQPASQPASCSQPASQQPATGYQPSQPPTSHQRQTDGTHTPADGVPGGANDVLSSSRLVLSLSLGPGLGKNARHCFASR